MAKITVDKLHTLTGHNDSIYTLKSIDDRYFLSGAGDGMVVLWDLENPGNGTLLVRVPGSVYAVDYDADKKQLIAGQNYEGLHFINLEDREEKFSVKTDSKAIFDIMHADGEVFAATGSGTVYVIDQELRTTVAKLKYSEKSARTIAINHRTQELAVGYSDWHIRIFDLKTYALKKEIPAHKNSVFTLVYTPDGKYLLSAGRDAHIKFWETDNNYHSARSIVAHMYAVNSLACSPNGKHFVSCSMDKSVKVWETETGRLLKVVDKARHAGHGNSVNKIIWTHRENQVVSGGDDRTIAIWDIKTGDKAI